MSKNISKANPQDNLSFEEAYQKLQNIVEALEGDSQSLEETVKLYKEGKNLSQRCSKLLEDAKFEVENVENPQKL